MAACMLAVRPPHPQNLATTLPTVKMIVEVSKSACILTTQVITKLLKSKEAAAAVDIKTWPTILDTDDMPKKKLANIFRPTSPDMLAYLDFSVSTTGILAGVKVKYLKGDSYFNFLTHWHILHLFFLTENKYKNMSETF